jgi:hypothetical protein
MLSINMLFAHRLQEFYTGGEREAMADEISNLRDQVEKESCMYSFIYLKQILHVPLICFRLVFETVSLV